jgi:predicted house-cleaning noncanonical NTP pyrophosphatase (MazG superfamily)
MTVYNKLIRDRVPEIIKSSGKECKVVTLLDKDYILELNKKLMEEVTEYYQSQTTEELADIVEVIYAILKFNNISIEDFEDLRAAKAIKRGIFTDKLFLEEVIEP